MADSDASPECSPARKRMRLGTDPLSSLLRRGGCTISGRLYQCDDPRQLAYDIDNRLMTHGELREAVMESVEERLDDNDSLRYALLPMAPTTPGLSHSGDSLVRTLLNVSCIQMQMATLVLQKLPEFVEDGVAAPRGASLPQLILSQFRWLDHVVSSAELTAAVLQVLPVCPEGLQREIVLFLPEVAMDPEHAMVVDALEELVNEDMAFLAPAMDAFGTISLDTELKNRVVDMVSQKLDAVDVAHLPAAVRFLLQSATSDNARRVAMDLRATLHLASAADARSSAPDRKQKGKAGGNGGAAILDALRTGLRFQPIMCQTFLREIKEVGAPGHEHRMLDVWVLLVVHAMGGAQKKAVEATLTKKVAAGHVTIRLLKGSVLEHAAALAECFPSLVRWAEVLLRAREAGVQSVGGELYILLFRSFTSGYHRQEVLGSLVAHTGSGTYSESCTALGVLVTMTNAYADAVMPFSTFINSLLDYLDTFQESQLVSLFEVFSALAVASYGTNSEAGDGHVDMHQDTLRMVIRKQMSSPQLKYKRIGVIAGVALAGRLARVNPALQDATSDAPAQVKAALELIEMMQGLCLGQPLCEAFLFDQLASLVDDNDLHPEVLKFLYDRTQTLFETSYVDDLGVTGCIPEDQAHHQDSLGYHWSSEAWYNLDGEGAPIIVRILPLLTSQSPHTRQSLLVLCPVFRLLQTMERRMHQSVEAIDAVLGCPLELCAKEAVCEDNQDDAPSLGKLAELAPAQAETLCASLAYAVNWIRELLGAYAIVLPDPRRAVADAGRDPEHDFKLLTRVKNLMALEAILGECMRIHAHVKLPPMGEPQHRSSESGSGRRRDASRATKSQADKGARGVGRGVLHSQRSAGEPSDAADATPSGTAAAVATPDVPTPRTLDTSFYRPLQATALRILAIPPLANVPEAESIGVYKYLLADLNIKVVAACKPSNPFNVHRSSDSSAMSTKTLLQQIEPLFPHICRHLHIAVDVLKLEASSTQPESGVGAQSASQADAQGTVYLVLNILHCLLGSPDLRTGEGSLALLALIESFALPVNGIKPVHRRQSTEHAVRSLTVPVIAVFDLMESMLSSINLEPWIEVLIIQVMALLVRCLEHTVSLLPASPGDCRRVQARLAAAAELKGRLGEAAGCSLQRERTGKQLGALLGMHLRYSEKPLETLTFLATSVFPLVNVVDKKKDQSRIEGYPMLLSSNFSLWYRVACEELSLLFERWTKSLCQNSDFQVDDALDEGLRACRTLHALVHLTKTHGSRIAVLSSSLTFGARCLNSFLKAMDYLEPHMNSHMRTLVDLVKEMQRSTRLLHIVVGETKNRKDGSALAAKVPIVKRSMERFVFRVKLLTHGTELGKAFWVGNLKHKDLSGQAISSQIPCDDDGEDEPEDEQCEEDADQREVDDEGVYEEEDAYDAETVEEDDAE